MNKKTVAMITSLVVGSTLLFGTAFANASQLSGYEAYKAAALHTKDLKDGTVNLNVSLTDGSEKLIDLSSNLKVNMNSKAMSSKTSVKSKDTTTTLENYTQDGKNVSKSSLSDAYMVRESRKGGFDKADKAANPQIVKSAEAVVDALVGNMKDGFNVDNGKISINLNENQVTPLINAVTSMVITASSNEQMHNRGNNNINIKDVVPKLQNDIKISNVTVTGDIDKDNIIKDQVANIEITGTDEQGVVHKVVLNVSLNLSDINSTTPDTVDLTGKQVKAINDHFRGQGGK